MSYLANAHEQNPDCDGKCCIHSPSDHHMKAWPLNWRNDIKVMERMCIHGVGHPDPDHLKYVAIAEDQLTADCQSVHGCDGCCSTLP